MLPVIRWYEGGTKRERATGTDDYQRAVEAPGLMVGGILKVLAL